MSIPNLFVVIIFVACLLKAVVETAPNSTGLSQGDIYDRVIDDVIENMKQPFYDDGADESLLTDLRVLWMEKLSMHNAAVGQQIHESQRKQASAVSAPSNFYPHNQHRASTAGTTGAAKGKGKLPQLDGAGDEDTVALSPLRDPSHLADRLPQSCRTATSTNVSPSGAVPDTALMPGQLDGAGEEDDALGSSDDGFNSDDDEDADEEDEDENFMICQFEKVNRTKNRYRCQLKNAIMQINGTDYMFRKVQGEWEW
eukprot:m.201261 g.201261  ORF g.201261 m.201261 type:complete len:255 (+) comp18799_c0_seq1:366-1130(+)